VLIFSPKKIFISVTAFTCIGIFHIEIACGGLLTSFAMLDVNVLRLRQ